MGSEIVLETDVTLRAFLSRDGAWGAYRIDYLPAFYEKKCQERYKVRPRRYKLLDVENVRNREEAYAFILSRGLVPACRNIMISQNLTRIPAGIETLRRPMLLDIYVEEDWVEERLDLNYRTFDRIQVILYYGIRLLSTRNLHHRVFVRASAGLEPE